MLKSAKRSAIIWTFVMLGISVTVCETVAGESCPRVGFTVVERHATSETRPLRVGKDQTIFVQREWLTTTSDIADIKLAGDDDNALILIKFTRVAERRLHEATSHHSGMRIAFLFDDRVLSNVVWEGPYGMDTGGTQVSIRHGMHQAQKLMKAIHGCTAATVGDRTP